MSQIDDYEINRMREARASGVVRCCGYPWWYSAGKCPKCKGLFADKMPEDWSYELRSERRVTE